MAIDKKLAMKAVKERYLTLEMGMSDQKQKEMMEMRKTRESMVQKLEEMAEKIHTLETELEVDRIDLEDLGKEIYEMVVKIDSGELTDEEMKEIQRKKLADEIVRIDKMDGLEKKKKNLQKLIQKKIKLKHQRYILEQYLKKYDKDIKKKEMESINYIVVCDTHSDEEPKRRSKRAKVSIVLNTFRTLSKHDGT